MLARCSRLQYCTGMHQLTDRQSECLQFIGKFIREKGYAPGFREIGTEMGIVSINGVRDHLRALERKGYISRPLDGEARAIRLLKPEDFGIGRLDTIVNVQSNGKGVRIMLSTNSAKLCIELPPSEIEALRDELTDVLVDLQDLQDLRQARCAGPGPVKAAP